jgi:hypothetical protein
VSAGPSGTLARVLDYVTVTRYVTPLREGGSLPALVEADNLGTYVMKFRGAGQGPLALVAEAHAELAPRITETLLKDVTALVPGEWFGDRGADAYTEHLLARAPIVPEVIRR